MAGVVSIDITLAVRIYVYIVGIKMRRRGNIRDQVFIIVSLLSTNIYITRNMRVGSKCPSFSSIPQRKGRSLLISLSIPRIFASIDA